jgi:hypothetical protein
MNRLKSRSLALLSGRIQRTIRPPLPFRQNASLTPRPTPPSPEKPSLGVLSDLGNPEASKPMFEQLALLSPAIIPHDTEGIIRLGDGAATLLDNSALVVERRLEMLNVFLVGLLSLTFRAYYRDLSNAIVM